MAVVWNNAYNNFANVWWLYFRILEELRAGNVLAVGAFL